MRILLFALILLLIGCDLAGRAEQSLHLGNVELKENPTTFPLDLPSFLRYPTARMVRSAEYASGSFVGYPEGAVLLESTDSSADVMTYYMSRVRQNGWKILQSINEPSEKLLMLESPYQKLITVIMRGNAPTAIKIYYKKSSTD